MSRASELKEFLDDFLFTPVPVLIDLIVATVYLCTTTSSYIVIGVLVTGILYSVAAVKGYAWITEKTRHRNVKLHQEKRVFYQSLDDWTQITIFGRQEYETMRFSTARRQHLSSEFLFRMSFYVVETLLGAIPLLGLMGASFMSAFKVAQGNATRSSFIFLVTFWLSAMVKVSEVTDVLRNSPSFLVSAENLARIIQNRPATQDDGQISVDEVHKLEFDNVSASYGGGPSVIDGITFTAEAGSTVAIVGATGSGKSTIFNLIFHMIEASAGAIKINDHSIKNFKREHLRKMIGWFHQDGTLRNATIEENVRYGNLEATDDEVRAACKAAGVHDCIMRFKEGYQTFAGERGSRVSKGQAQRILLARVLMTKPQILLLDEATSALDPLTEQAVNENLKRFCQQRITFIIAHRLAITKHADLVLVMDKGEVIERGRHEDLLREQGAYYRIWSLEKL